ncbi:HAD-IG family 5'-nucleotidase [Legionella gresilensis]|uniref:HAD-IG family 5'-nucleotidase n=1 Tax=Legionella gresilensis TaxID=91823 RepID=UPI0010410046|nr:HAD-IG family 5'-nucleotidase [Legionella gresilensis]
MDQKVFVNRIINMKKIKLIGLDMDHTLIRYNTKNFETLVYKIVIEKLIKDRNYPTRIREFQFNFDDAIRGLIVDSRNGNILKLSRYGAIRQSYHGTKLISYPEQKKIYQSIYVDLKDPNYMAIDTSFSIAFCVLYSQLIDYKDQYPNELPSYNKIALDVLSSVDKAHADGSIKNYISEHLDDYVLKEKAVVEGLKRLKRYGKRIFILTNSEYSYTKLLLEYAINPFLEPNEDWRDLFEYVITLAGKPRFFYDNPRFLAVNPVDATMTNFHGEIKPGIYQGGCARKFTEDLQVKGDEILYIGDHIYGDILRLKKDCNWRTALVVEELSEEVASQKRALPVEKQIIAAMETKKEFEQKYIDLYTKSIDEDTQIYQEEINNWQQQIAKIDTHITALLKEQQAFYNPRWGRIFRAGAEESYFAYQVDRFACIYMEKLSDLLAHSPLTYFRANRRRLAHDIEI